MRKNKRKTTSNRNDVLCVARYKGNKRKMKNREESPEQKHCEKKKTNESSMHPEQAKSALLLILNHDYNAEIFILQAKHYN